MIQASLKSLILAAGLALITGCAGGSELSSEIAGSPATTAGASGSAGSGDGELDALLIGQAFPEELQTSEVYDCAAAALDAGAANGVELRQSAVAESPESLKAAVEVFRSCTDEPVAPLGYMRQATANGMPESVGVCLTDLAIAGEIDHAEVYPLTDHRASVPLYPVEQLGPLIEGLVSCTPGSTLTVAVLELAGAQIMNGLDTNSDALDLACLDASVGEELRRTYWETALLDVTYSDFGAGIDLIGEEMVPCISVGRQLSATAGELGVVLDDQQVACLDEGTEGMGYRDFFAPRRLADAMSSCLTSEQMTALAAAG